MTTESEQNRVAIEDGVIERLENAVTDTALYQSIAKVEQQSTRVYRVVCVPDKGRHRECAAPGAMAANLKGKTNA